MQTSGRTLNCSFLIALQHLIGTWTSLANFLRTAFWFTELPKSVPKQWLSILTLPQNSLGHKVKHLCAPQTPKDRIKTLSAPKWCKFPGACSVPHCTGGAVYINHPSVLPTISNWQGSCQLWPNELRCWSRGDFPLRAAPSHELKVGKDFSGTPDH